MKFAVFTVSLPDYTPTEAAPLLRECGYDGVEWRVTDEAPKMTGHAALPGFWEGNRCTLSLKTLIDDAPRIRALTEAAGLAMPSVGTYVSCEEIDQVEHAMEGVRALGAPALRVRVPNYDGKAPYLKLRDQAIGQYRDVEALAKQYRVKALVEMHMNNIVPSASACASFMHNFDPRYVGIIHDVGNMVYEGYEQYRLGLEVLGPYLAHVHLKNSRWEVTGTRPDGSTEWKAAAAPFSKGIVNVAALFEALAAVGYDGWMSFEDFSLEVPLAQRTRENLIFARQFAK